MSLTPFHLWDLLWFFSCSFTFQNLSDTKVWLGHHAMKFYPFFSPLLFLFHFFLKSRCLSRPGPCLIFYSLSVAASVLPAGSLPPAYKDKQGFLIQKKRRKKKKKTKNESKEKKIREEPSLIYRPPPITVTLFSFLSSSCPCSLTVLPHPHWAPHPLLPPSFADWLLAPWCLWSCELQGDSAKELLRPSRRQT